jgi:hypothetical protein
MTPTELRTELKRLRVTPPDDPLRACLYLQHIQDTYTFFNTTLRNAANNGGLGAGYSFVATAVQDPELLNALCNALDEFLCPAIQAHLLTAGNNLLPDFQTYYANNFLNANYPANVTAFFNTYVVTRDILLHIAQNFRNNILQACQRIYNDRAAIAKAFASGAEISKLTKIKSTGSDFHKGGKQVLILTFYMKVYVSVSIPPPPSLWLNLIYKPSDIETDCLIVGDSATVNAQHHIPQPFQDKSLFEILNTGIAAALRNDPTLSLALLPTYRILPMAYTSTEPPDPVPTPLGYQLNIRRAYGYIEFLPHSHYSGPWNFYAFGNSDYKIFPKQDKNAICRKFYRLIGQISAIAATFSISDLHAENLIVKNYLPYLIDLEISLTLPILEISNTVLYNRTEKAGVNGARKEDDFAYRQERVRNILQINDHQEAAFGQNRMMTVTGSLIDPGGGSNPSYICKGLRDMIDVIQSANAPHNNQDLNAWIARVNNILVRNLPMATGDFRTLVKVSANSTRCTDNTALGRIVDTKRGDLFQQWRGDHNLNPDFLALQNAYVVNDFNNGDIPIFYHRIGPASVNIVDSDGNEVRSPGNISYRDSENAPLQQAAYALPGPRTAFFPASPFTTNVVNTQLARVTNNVTKTPRVQVLVGQILDQLGLQNGPLDINNILA